MLYKNMYAPSTFSSFFILYKISKLFGAMAVYIGDNEHHNVRDKVWCSKGIFFACLIGFFSVYEFLISVVYDYKTEEENHYFLNETRLGKVFYNMNSLSDDSIYFYISSDLLMIIIHSFTVHNIKHIFEMLHKTEVLEVEGNIFKESDINRLRHKERRLSRILSIFIVASLLLHFAILTTPWKFPVSDPVLGVTVMLSRILFCVNKTFDIAVLCQFCGLCYILRNRYSHINVVLYRLSQQVEEASTRSLVLESIWQKENLLEHRSSRNNIATIFLNVSFIMSRVGSAYSSLCDIVDILNCTFKYQLMIMILTSYLYNVIFGYFMSTSGVFMSMKFFSTGILKSTHGTLLSFITITSISFAADSVVSQAQLCRMFASHVDSRFLPISEQEMVMATVKRLSYRKIYFKLFGIFNLNSPFVFSLIAAAVTLVTLLLQINNEL